MKKHKEQTLVFAVSNDESEEERMRSNRVEERWQSQL
jgi:hypothetical protein